MKSTADKVDELLPHPRGLYNYRTDVAWGREGLEFYISLGEEF
jgi:hypothetical protein